MARDAAALRNALQEILADLRLSSTAHKSDVLYTAQTAVRDVDRLVAALNKWAPNSANESHLQTLQQAVRAVDASETPSSCPWARLLAPSKGEKDLLLLDQVRICDHPS
jgi:hypothetical protein